MSPYKIKEVGSGYKVCKTRGKKCFSKKPLTKKTAEKQKTAIILSGLRKAGRIPERK